jgi:hypothetical protein
MVTTKLSLFLTALLVLSGPAFTHSSVYCYQSGAGIKGGGSITVSSFRIVVEQLHLNRPSDQLSPRTPPAIFHADIRAQCLAQLAS